MTKKAKAALYSFVFLATIMLMVILCYLKGSFPFGKRDPWRLSMGTDPVSLILLILKMY